MHGTRGFNTCSVPLPISSNGERVSPDIMDFSHSEDWIDFSIELQKVISARSVGSDVVKTSFAEAFVPSRYISIAGGKQPDFSKIK